MMMMMMMMMLMTLLMMMMIKMMMKMKMKIRMVMVMVMVIVVMIVVMMAYYSMISVVFEEPRDEVFEETFPQSHWARVTKVLPHRRNKGPPKQRSFNTLVVLNLFPCAPPKNNKTEAKNWVLCKCLDPFRKGAWNRASTPLGLQRV